MKHLVRLSAFTFFFSFIFGLIWSVYLRRPDHLTHSERLTLLIPHSLESLGFSKQLTAHSDILVTPVVYKDFSELEKALESGPAQAAIIPSSVASRLINLKLLPTLPKSISSLLSLVHVDFKSLNFDPDNKYTFPLLWGVNGFASVKKTSTTKNDNSLPSKGVSLIDDFVQIHLLNANNAHSRSYHQLTTPSLRKAKASHSFVQLPVSFYQLFENIPSENDQPWMFTIPDNTGQFWVLSLNLIDKKKTKATQKLLQFMFSKSFYETFLEQNPLGVTYLTLQNIPESQHPNFLRTLPLKKIQIREISKSDLLEKIPTTESN